MPPRSLEGTANRGSYFGRSHELRVTRRCLAEDIGVGPDAPFEAVMDDPLVKALVRERSDQTNGAKTVGPAAGADTLYRLSHGDRNRGATWWDEAEGVVWLCATHYNHESGSAGDSFVYFDQLIADGEMKPTAEDYEALYEERDQWFYDHALGDAQELLAVARADPGFEARGVIGKAIDTGVVVEVIETLEEIFVAFMWADLPPDPTAMATLLAAFVPESQLEDWQSGGSHPTRALEEGEALFRYLKEREPDEPGTP